MGTRTKESRRRIHSLILLIAFTAILLIVSTYAWFTTQKDVTISNLRGTIEVAESLEISLDGKLWGHKVTLTDDYLKDETKVLDPKRNIIPTELLPLSSIGATNADKSFMKLTSVSFNGGLLTKFEDATEACTTDLESEASAGEGYFAFDIYLKNLSKDYDDFGRAVYSDILKLNSNSYAWVLSEGNEVSRLKSYVDENGMNQTYTKVYNGKESQGLQNTLRIAFARYGDGTTETATQGILDSGASLDDIKNNYKTAGAGAGTQPMTISAVSIWEPNSDLHTESVYGTVRLKSPQFPGLTGEQIFSTTTGTIGNTKVTFKVWDNEAEGGPKDIESVYVKDSVKLNTYAIKDGATLSETDDPIDPNDWTQGTYFGEQKTVKTTTYNEYGKPRYINEGVTTLKETTDLTKNFTLAANSITKVRVYVWMEGQDPDCTNDNTQAGGIELQIGLVKSATDGTFDKRNEELTAPAAGGVTP